MPLAFILIGALLVIVAIRGTHAQLGQLLVEDFTGQGAQGLKGSFLVWIAAIGGVAALGLIPGMKIPARMLLALVILVLLISNRGVFANAASALTGTIPGVTVTTAQSTPTESQLPAAIPVQVTGTTGSSSPASQAAGAAGTAANVIKSVPIIGSLFGGM